MILELIGGQAVISLGHQRKLIELHGLDPNEETFASLIRRHGGDEALERIRWMCQS